VCMRKAAASKGVMIPGTTACPAGFSADYTGYLFAPSNAYTRGMVREEKKRKKKKQKK
jgi:hypothetical protein